MSRQGRGLVVTIFKNFLDSFKAKRVRKGNLIGTDYLGTKYFEVPADPQGGLRKPIRSYEPTIAEKFDQNVPPEWEAWLRGRRVEPPTAEEIQVNLDMIKLKQKNAAEIDLKFPPKKKLNVSNQTGKESFPSYNDEYEHTPGIKRGQEK